MTLGRTSSDRSLLRALPKKQITPLMNLIALNRKQFVSRYMRAKHWFLNQCYQRESAAMQFCAKQLLIAGLNADSSN
jgi:hypothetical protein